MFPRLAKANAINRPAVDAKRLGYGSASHTNGVGSYLTNDVLCDNGPMVAIPSGPIANVFFNAVSQNLARVGNILLVAAPLKVVWAVVKFVAVDMVYLRFSVYKRQESKGDHSMKAVGLFHVSKHGSRHAIAAFVDRAFDNALWTAKSAERAGFKAVGAGNTSPFFNHLALQLPYLA